MSGGTEYAEALVRAEAEIARLRRELERRAGAASPAPRDGGENPPAVLADAALLLRRSDPEIASGLDALIRSWPAAPRDEDPAPTHDGAWWLEDAARKAETWAEAADIRGALVRANALRDFAAALRGQAASLREQKLAPPSPPSGPERCVALDEYPRCSQPPVPGSNLCWAHGGDMFGKPPPSGPDSGSNEEG